MLVRTEKLQNLSRGVAKRVINWNKRKNEDIKKINSIGG